MPTLAITNANNVTIYEDEGFDGDPAVFWESTFVSGSLPTLINYGVITSSTYAFQCWNGHGLIDNRGTVHVSNPDGPPPPQPGNVIYAITGLYSINWSPDIANSGTWWVEAPEAWGIVTWTPPFFNSPRPGLLNTGEWIVNGSTSAYGMAFANGGWVVNEGHIIVTGGQYWAIALEMEGETVVNNSGLIEAYGALEEVGINAGAYPTSYSGPNITNSGTITAETAIRSLMNGTIPQLQILNTGHINGDIDLFWSTLRDTIDNRNDINGDVFMAAGNDLVDTTLGVINGQVWLQEGNDELRGGAQRDEAYGGDGADLMTGNGGADELHGGNGADTLTGSAGDDDLSGDAGVDTARYAVAATAATWVRHPDGSWTVNAGGDGVDTVRGVETLHFTDRDVHLDTASRTFSGDGTSDILFRRDDGIMASWEVTGTSINSAAFLPAAGSEWTPLGAGDFSGDGRADVVWERNDGVVYIWRMNGGSVAAAYSVAGIGPEWHFLGAGDLNGDLIDDLAWQRNDGVVFVWQMNTTIASSAVVAGLGAEWELQGLGDFNGDGRDDFLWRNSSGQTVIWHMNGATIQGAGATSAQAGLDWSIVGIGDTNGDGRDDMILQRASDGMIAIWAMNGTSVLSATNVGAADPGVWSVRGIGDYNGDGRDDILWQTNDGLVYVWLMNGATIESAGALSGIGPEWGII